MLETYSVQNELLFDDASSRGPGIAHYWDVAKRRVLYFLIPMAVILPLGAFVAAIQRPIYEASGKVLVESQQIPTDLVQPTVTGTANERIQVIQQRIMTRDNLLALIKKYQMFPHERQWMSDTQLLDLMRQRTSFQKVDVDSASGQPTDRTIAFTVSFQYENPDITLRVANDLLTLIIDEDARNRTNKAADTTQFLLHESQRLQNELAAIEAQITEDRIKPRDGVAEAMDPSKIRLEELIKLKDDLAQLRATYSDEYPAVKQLQRKIAAIEKLAAKAPSPAAQQADTGLVELERQAGAKQRELDDNNKKLEAARLGERLEQDQKAERLTVIEQPVTPQMPVKPNRTKLLALSLALAIAAGLSSVFAAESLDGSIRSSRELLGVTNGRLIVSLPYIATRAETIRKRSKVAILIGLFCAVVVGGVVVAVLYGPAIDLSWVNQFWLDHLTHLTK